VESPKPWGLGTEYSKFRFLIAPEIGEQEFDRLTVSECLSAGRPSMEEENRCVESNKSERERNSRLRAINRAPEVIQRLYDHDLFAVDLAAKFGAEVRDGKVQEERTGAGDGRGTGPQVTLPRGAWQRTSVAFIGVPAVGA
jgi:hypothetical protein